LFVPLPADGRGVARILDNARALELAKDQARAVRRAPHR
jgi:hypothetical protein